VNNQDSLTAGELESRGVLLVQDGNHGEQRPRSNEFVPAGVSFIRAADMSDGIVNFDIAECINEIAFQRIRKGIGKPEDVIFSSKGTVGKIAQVARDCPAFVCSPQTTFWRSLDQSILKQKYLFYFLSSPSFKEQWEARKGETDMADYVSLTAQRELRVFLPSVAMQDSIVSTLSPIDDRIQLNLKMNRLLEATTSAIFRSWFVNFDPISAKSECRTPFGMNEKIAALFPREFEDNAKGAIPKGWTAESLDSIANFKNGLAMQKYPPNESGSLPVVKIAELRAGSTIGAELAAANLPQDAIVDDGDVIFSWSGTLLVRIWCGGKGALNQHLFKVTSSRFPKWFYLGWTLEHLSDFEDIADDKKTTMGHIKRHHLTDATVAVPPDPLIQAADRIISPLLNRYVLNSVQNRALRSLRDSLLPPLISGEFELRGNKQPTEEVLA
jgi:type I restriction enzyme S subunit